MMKDTSHPWNPYAIEPPGSSIAETSCTNRSGAGAYADSYPYPPSPARARSLAFSRASASFSSRSLLRSARTLEISWKCLSNARLERPALSTLSPKNARPAHTKTTKFFETVTAFVGSPELRLWRPTCLRSRRSEPVVNRRLAANGRADFETEPSTSVSPYRLDAESSSRRDESDRRSPERLVLPSTEFLAESSMRLCQDTEPGLRSASAREDARFADLLDAQLAMIAPMRPCALPCAGPFRGNIS